MNWYETEDEQQEYICCLLEGMTDEQAEKQARKRARRRPFFGSQTLIAYDQFGYETDLSSLTLDSRSSEEREESWSKDIGPVKALATPREWELISLSFGLTTGTPMTNAEVAAQAGCTAQHVSRAIRFVRGKVQKFGTKEAHDAWKREQSRLGALSVKTHNNQHTKRAA